VKKKKRVKGGSKDKVENDQEITPEKLQAHQNNKWQSLGRTTWTTTLAQHLFIKYHHLQPIVKKKKNIKDKPEM
jgi:hypothetical protein